MATYVIVQNPDRTQTGMFPKSEENMQLKHLMWDVDGIPMIVIHEFEANSWNEAMTIYHEFMGFEPYVPMEGTEDL